jgi:hypothetical protein
MESPPVSVAAESSALASEYHELHAMVRAQVSETDWMKFRSRERRLWRRKSTLLAPPTSSAAASPSSSTTPSQLPVEAAAAKSSTSSIGTPESAGSIHPSVKRRLKLELEQTARLKSARTSKLASTVRHLARFVPCILGSAHPVTHPVTTVTRTHSF